MTFPTIYFSKAKIITFFKSIHYALFILLLPWQYIMKQDRWQDFEVSVEYYNRVLMLKGNESYYYKPMSALQIAFIYEKENNLQKANFFFNKCLSMTGFDYEKSIHQKAKAGLERLY